MAHQTKVFRGSRSLCGCGCGRRKTSFRRRFASGCNGERIRKSQYQENRVRNDKPVTGSGTRPSRLIKEPRVAWTPEPNEFYRATVNKVLQGFYFAQLSQGEQCFINADAVQGPQGHHCFLCLDDEVSVRL